MTPEMMVALNADPGATRPTLLKAVSKPWAVSFSSFSACTASQSPMNSYLSSAEGMVTPMNEWPAEPAVAVEKRYSTCG